MSKHDDYELFLGVGWIATNEIQRERDDSEIISPKRKSNKCVGYIMYFNYKDTPTIMILQIGSYNNYKKTIFIPRQTY